MTPVQQKLEDDVPQSLFCFLMEYVTSFPMKGRCLLGYSWIDRFSGLHEGVSRPAEHQHTLSQPKVHFPYLCDFCLIGVAMSSWYIW